MPLNQSNHPTGINPGRGLRFREGLVRCLFHFEFPRGIYPELNKLEHPSILSECIIGSFAVDNSVARIHPLGSTLLDQLIIPEGIAMPQTSRINAGYWAEPSVRMRAYADVIRGLVAWQEILPMVQQEKGTYAFKLLRG
jgi:hypothetical protein